MIVHQIRVGCEESEQTIYLVEDGEQSFFCQQVFCQPCYSYETKEEQKIPEFKVIMPTEAHNHQLLSFARAVLDGNGKSHPCSSDFRDERRMIRQQQAYS